MARTILAVIALLVASGALAPEAAGQTTTGGITGVVRDSGGALVAGATVTATHEGTNARSTAVSNDLGVYALTGLAVGRHTIVAERDGFRTFQHPGVLVRVNDEVRLDIGLEVGAISETLTVSGQARTVDTVTGTLKTVVDQERLEQLPLNGRNPANLLQLVAGVLPDRSDLLSGTTYPGVQPVSSSGARGNTINYVLDGGSNNDHYNNAPNPMPNPDALAGVQRPDQQLQRRIRPERGGGGQRGDPCRLQPVPRPRVRLLPSLQVQRHQLLHAGRGRWPGAAAVRRHLRRSRREGSYVLLRVLPGDTAGAASDVAVDARSDGGHAQRRLLGHPAAAPEPVHEPAVPEQPDPDVAVQRAIGADCQRVPPAPQRPGRRQSDAAPVRTADGERRSPVSGPGRSLVQQPAPHLTGGGGCRARPRRPTSRTATS